MTQLELRNIVFGYKKNEIILNGISLKVDKGYTYAIVGRNGIGKSTLFGIILKELKAQSGEIKVTKPLEIGYVPQEIALLDNLSVAENLKFFSKINKVSNSDKAIKQVVKDFSLEDVLEKKVSKLSGGYKRRVNFASSVLHEPNLFLLDEPFEGVDKESKNIIQKYLLDLKNKNKTIIFITHHSDEIRAIGDFIIYFADKKIEKIIPIDEYQQARQVKIKVKDINKVDLSILEGKKYEIRENNIIITDSIDFNEITANLEIISIIFQEKTEG